MATLSSRPTPPSSSTTPSHQDVLKAAQPSINLLHWLTQRMKFDDNSIATVAAATDVLEEALECMEVDDYAVMPIPSLRNHLTFDIALKPLDVGAFVFFQVHFQVI